MHLATRSIYRSRFSIAIAGVDHAPKAEQD